MSIPGNMDITTRSAFAPGDPSWQSPDMLRRRAIGEVHHRSRLWPLGILQQCRRPPLIRQDTPDLTAAKRSPARRAGLFRFGLLRGCDYFQPLRSNQAFITQPPTKGSAQLAVEMNTSRVVSGRFTHSVPMIGETAAQPIAVAP